MGCRANQADSAALEGILAQEGWRLVDFDSVADAYILNTCTVTNNADQEARYLIRRAHRKNPEASIIVTGCSAQTNPKALAQVEGVSFVVGNTQKSSILDYLKKAKPLVPEIIVKDIFQEEAIFTSDFATYSKNTRAFVKVQDGCNQMCSYCVIPFARGKNRSLAPDKILQELYRLKEKGFLEAVLTGIHIGTYGVDLEEKSSLLALMRRIEEESPIHRVRISSIDPEEVSSEMVDFLEESKVFCAHLHIPVQSGDNEILKLMRRRYSAEEFLDLSLKLKEKIPEICLGTDIMPGFPYEDEERFEKSFQLLEKSPIDYLHVFPYSAKDKTRAALFQSQVPVSVKRERVKRLTDLSQAKKENFYQRALGHTQEVILEEKVGDEWMKGTSRNYLPVCIPITGDVEEPLKGKLVFAQISRYDHRHVFSENFSRR